MRFDTGGGYIRGVMAGMKPIANDAGIRDRRAKRELGYEGPNSPANPFGMAAISNVQLRNKFNRNGVAQRTWGDDTAASNVIERLGIFPPWIPPTLLLTPLARLTRRWLDLSNFPGKRMFRSVEAGGGCRNDSNESISCFLDRDTIEEKRKRT